MALGFREKKEGGNEGEMGARGKAKFSFSKNLIEK